MQVGNSRLKESMASSTPKAYISHEPPTLLKGESLYTIVTLLLFVYQFLYSQLSFKHKDNTLRKYSFQDSLDYSTSVIHNLQDGPKLEFLILCISHNLALYGDTC